MADDKYAGKSLLLCGDCKELVYTGHVEEHPDLCCDCFDRACGKPLKLINPRRVAKGLPPLKRRKKAS